MPLEYVHSDTDHAWGLWRVTEDEQELANEMKLVEQVPATFTNPVKRLEFLAGRLLLKTLLQQWALTFEGLTKDEFGKPYLRNFDIHLSLSHSYPHVAAIIHRRKIVGIDLEQPKSKLLNIAHRVLNDIELADAETNLVKHCIYWCAKEALIKIHGKKDLTLSKNLAIEPFLLQNQGNLIGSIIVHNTATAVSLRYIVYDNFVVVFNH